MLRIAKILGLGLFCLLGACKGQWIATYQYESYTEAREALCYTLGWCQNCRWIHRYSFCSYGAYHRCPGTKQILVRVTPEDGYYVNHPDKIVKRESIYFLRELTKCKVSPSFMLKEGQYTPRKVPE